MSVLSRLRDALGRLGRRSAIDRDLDDELRAYVDAAAEARRAAGLSANDASRAARADLGSLAAVKDRVHDVGWESWIERLGLDVRFAARGLRKSPGFTLAAVATVALGIAPNTVVGAVVDYLFAPLPVARPDDLVVLATARADETRVHQRLAYLDVENYRSRSNVFEDLARWDLDEVSVVSETAAENVLASDVSGNYFGMLGLRPATGRLLAPADDAIGGPRVVVLGYDYWIARFNADPSIIGRVVQVNGAPTTIVGVAPRGFDGTFRLARPEVYLPLSMRVTASRRADRDDLSVRVIGRLRPGVSVRQAQAAVDVETRQLERAYPETNTGRRTRVYAQRLAASDPQIASSTIALAISLLLLVLVVLLVACGNVLGLFLARGVGRRRELAIRAALGASRSQLVRICLTEAALIAIAGGALGSAGGWLVARDLSAIATNGSPGLPLYVNLIFSWRLCAFLAALMGLTIVTVGTWPAWNASRADPRADLDEGRTTDSRAKQRLQSIRVCGQMAVSVALLVIAGLFVRSVEGLESVDLGFDPRPILLATVTAPSSARDAAATAAFFRDVSDAVGGIPGVAGAAEAESVPFDNSGSTSGVARDDEPSPRVRSKVKADREVVSANYFETIGTGLLAGRTFSMSDDDRAPRVAIVNQAMAQRLWPGQDAVGRRFREAERPGDLIAVVGVAANARYRLDEMTGAARPRYFLSMDQPPPSTRVLLVRAITGSPDRLAGDVRRAIHRLAPTAAVSDIVTLDAQVRFGSNGFGGAYALSSVTGVLGGCALVLALVGAYGVLALAVGQRVREIGILLALGAGRPRVVGSVIGQWARLTGVGLIVGLVIAAGIGRALEGWLFGVTPLDPWTLTLVAAGVAIASFLAVIVPLRRALAVDPLVVLRAE
jgi:predicted permease